MARVFGISQVGRRSTNRFLTAKEYPDDSQVAELRSVRYMVVPAMLAVLLVSASAARGDTPSGWFAAGSDPTGYEFTIDTTEKKGGKASGSYEAKDPKADNFGTAMQQFAADDFKGKRVRMSAWVKAKDVDERAGLWMRVDGAKKSPLAFDNMGERPIKGTRTGRNTRSSSTCRRTRHRSPSAS